MDLSNYSEDRRKELVKISFSLLLSFQYDIDYLNKELETTINENRDLRMDLNRKKCDCCNYISKLNDTDIENFMFDKIGSKETMTEKEYLIGMIMAKIIIDKITTWK